MPKVEVTKNWHKTVAKGFGKSAFVHHEGSTVSTFCLHFPQVNSTSKVTERMTRIIERVTKIFSWLIFQKPTEATAEDEPCTENGVDTNEVVEAEQLQQEVGSLLANLEKCVANAENIHRLAESGYPAVEERLRETVEKCRESLAELSNLYPDLLPVVKTGDV